MKFSALFVGSALLVGSAFAQNDVLDDKAALTLERKAEVLNDISSVMAKTAFVPGVDFTTWGKVLDTNKAEIEKAETVLDFTKAVNKALSQFGTSHFVLATPKAATARRDKKQVGMGIQIQVEEKGIRVMSVFPKSGASDAGLRPGDLILENNGNKVAAPTDLAGGDGEVSNLKLERDGKVVQISVTRRPYSNIRPETLTWADKDTAVLKVWTFDQAYNRDNVEKLMKEATASKRLIVDLRMNPGGAVMNLMHLMGLLMPEGSKVGTFLARRDVDRYVEETGGKPTDLEKIVNFSGTTLKAMKNKNVGPYAGKIAVLVNGASGSAAEIAAAALHDSLGAPVVGTRSAGAVLASIIRPIANGFTIQYPMMDYLTPQYRRLEGAGVEPTLETKGVLKFGEKDDSIEKAVILLQRLERING